MNPAIHKFTKEIYKNAPYEKDKYDLNYYLPRKTIFSFANQ